MVECKLFDLIINNIPPLDYNEISNIIIFNSCGLINNKYCYIMSIGRLIIQRDNGSLIFNFPNEIKLSINSYITELKKNIGERLFRNIFKTVKTLYKCSYNTLYYIFSIWYYDELTAHKFILNSSHFINRRIHTFGDYNAILFYYNKPFSQFIKYCTNSPCITSSILDAFDALTIN